MVRCACDRELVACVILERDLFSSIFPRRDAPAFEWYCHDPRVVMVDLAESCPDAGQRRPRVSNFVSLGIKRRPPAPEALARLIFF